MWKYAFCEAWAEKPFWRHIEWMDFGSLPLHLKWESKIFSIVLLKQNHCQEQINYCNFQDLWSRNIELLMIKNADFICLSHFKYSLLYVLFHFLYISNIIWGKITCQVVFWCSGSAVCQKHELMLMTTNGVSVPNSPLTLLWGKKLWSNRESTFLFILIHLFVHLFFPLLS